MTPEIHKKLLDFIKNVEDSSAARESFIGDPVKTIKAALDLKSEGDHDLSVANQVLLSVLSNKPLLHDLRDHSIKFDKKEINLDQLRASSAKSLIENLPTELKKKVNQHWITAQGSEIPSPVAMANIIVAVDTVAVLTEAAVIHSEVFFSATGDVGPGTGELQKLANVIAQGN